MNPILLLLVEFFSCMGGHLTIETAETFLTQLKQSILNVHPSHLTLAKASLVYF